MKTRPILFSSAMVRAILDGRKTQTRRIAKNLWNDDFAFQHEPEFKVLGLRPESLYKCPYGAPGHRLWVRESFWQECKTVNNAHPESGCNDPVNVWGKKVAYRDQFDSCPDGMSGRPSIHMPRWASRITLEITNVRVERLQDISERDAWAEGCEGWDDDVTGGYSAYDEFRDLWQSINGPGSWDENPWVWVIEFRRINEQQSAA